eukprot:996083-Rhodomonas_salina.1
MLDGASLGSRSARVPAGLGHDATPCGARTSDSNLKTAHACVEIGRDSKLSGADLVGSQHTFRQDQTWQRAQKTARPSLHWRKCLWNASSKRNVGAIDGKMGAIDEEREREREGTLWRARLSSRPMLPILICTSASQHVDQSEIQLANFMWSRSANEQI